MEVQSVETFKVDLREIENTVTQASTDVLSDQERRFETTLNEITQSIVSVSNGQEFIKLYSGEREVGAIDDDSSMVLDPRNMSTILRELNKLVELIKLTYLEKDTLDYFLRYTLTSTNLLELESEEDPRYVELAKNVIDLEQVTIVEHMQNVDKAKNEILEKNKELSMKHNQINRLYLDTTGIIDDCWEMLEELETLEALKKKDEDSNSGNEKMEEDILPGNETDNLIKETHNEWQSLQSAEVLTHKLSEELSQVSEVQKLKKANIEMKSNNNFNQDPKLAVEGAVLTKLITLWNNYFLPSLNIGDESIPLKLEIFPQTRKFQFNASNKYVVVFELNDDFKNSVKDIRFFQKENSSMTENTQIRQEFLTKYNKPIKNYEIWWIMEDILQNVN